MRGDRVYSILIVNYNGERYLRPCLDALRTQTLPKHRYEVILVDNGSADGSVPFVREHYPEVYVVEAGANLGFTGGNNLAAEVAHGDAVVLLNTDTVVDPTWLERLVDRHERDGGSVVSKLVFDADPAEINGTGLRLLRDGRWTDRGFRSPDRGQFETSTETWAGCGAAVLLPKSEAYFVLDPRYFMYYEDLDRGWGDRLAGATCRYEPSALVRHVHCGSSGEWSPFFTFHVERNRSLAALKNGDFLLAVLSALGLFARAGRALMRYAVSGCARGKGRLLAAHFRATLSYLRHFPAVLIARYQRRRGWL